VPIYELACEDGHRSETLQASTDPLPGHTSGATGEGSGAKRPVDGEGSGT
jgi:hypothetical protein